MWVSQDNWYPAASWHPIRARVGTAAIANCPWPLWRNVGQLWHWVLVSSRQVVETNLVLIITVLPVPALRDWLEVAWWHLTWTLEVQGQAQPCCHLSVPLGQGRQSQNCFSSLALPLSTAALGAYRFCIALALDCCSSPKAPERKSSKPKTPVGVFKGFWVWDNDPHAAS